MAEEGKDLSVVVDFSSATMSVCRAHLTKTVPAGLSTHHFAYTSSIHLVRFAVLPGAGSLLACIPEYRPLPFIPLNSFTYPRLRRGRAQPALGPSAALYPPGPASTSPGAACLDILKPGLAVRRATTDACAATESQSNQDLTSAVPPPPPAPLRPDLAALIFCLPVEVAFRCVMAQFESNTVPLLTEQHHITYRAASFRIFFIRLAELLIYVCLVLRSPATHSAA